MTYSHEGNSSDRIHTHNYDLQYELGPKNWIDQLAGKALVVGRQYRDTALEAMSQQLSEMVRDIHYDSDQFFRVEALAHDIDMTIRNIESLGAHTIEELTDQKDTSDRPWKYIFERNAEGYSIILDKWNTTWGEMGVSKSSSRRRIERLLDEQLQGISLQKEEKEKVFSGYSYEDTYFSDAQGVVRKIIQFHKHGSGDIGFRTIYRFPDVVASKDNVVGYWDAVKKVMQDVAHEETLPEAWEYHGGGERILIPKTAQLLETLVVEGGREVKLFHIPSESIDTLDGYFSSNPFAYAIAGADNRIAIMILTDIKVEKLEQLKDIIHRTVGAVDRVTIPQDNNSYGRIAHERTEQRDFRRVPAVYDEESQWLFFPMSKEFIYKLQGGSKSFGPSGTHYVVRHMNDFVNQLCEGRKIADIGNDDSLRDVDGLDLFKAHDGKVYIDADATRLGQDVVGGLSALHVHTSDRIPLFTGTGSLFELIVIEEKTNYRGQREERDENAVKIEVCEVMKKSLMDENAERNMWRSGKSLHLYLFEYLWDRAKRERLIVDEHLLNLASNYGEHGGIPAAALLYEYKKTPQEKPYYELIISGDHLDAEARIRDNLNNGTATILARVDGVLKVRPPHGSQYHFLLNFDYHVTHVTDRRGMALTGEVRTRAFAELEALAVASKKDLANLEKGIVLQVDVLEQPIE